MEAVSVRYFAEEQAAAGFTTPNDLRDRIYPAPPCDELTAALVKVFDANNLLTNVERHVSTVDV